MIVNRRENWLIVCLYRELTKNYNIMRMDNGILHSRAVGELKLCKLMNATGMRNICFVWRNHGRTSISISRVLERICKWKTISSSSDKVSCMVWWIEWQSEFL